MSPNSTTVLRSRLQEQLPVHKRRVITDEEVEVLARENAAIKIQRAWRAKKRAAYLGADFLWTDLVTHARFKVDRDAAADGGKNTARERWRRAIFLSLRLQDGNTMLVDDRVKHADAARKYLETQHWLELIDVKHRYGANLKYYHRKWQHEDTADNFFRWLDQGGGKDLSMKECPREQLEKERIDYLSPSQRLNYLVQIDSEGKLRWAKTGEVVDTTVGHWRDAGQGRGIIPFDNHEDPALQHRTSFVMPARGTAGSGSSLGSRVGDTQLHYYLGPRPTSSRIKGWLWRNLTPRGLLERLLRKTLQKNTWIYVSDQHFNIFVGIKTPGTFQHSSFLGGGLVTSAGLISVKEGVIHKLSPLSGHYRTSIQHFRYFLKVLEERGVDMHKIERSKAELALWGIEHLARFKKKQAKVAHSGKRKIDSTVDSLRKSLTGSSQDEDTTWKREIVEGKAKAKAKDSLSRNGPVRTISPHLDDFQGNQDAETATKGKPLPAEQTDFPADTLGAAMQMGENRTAAS